jgi:dishevelled associated activator of morphogenesis
VQHHWQLIDRLVQQITLQTKDGDPDQRPLSIDVKKMLKQLASENSMKELSQKMRELHKESDELAAKLAKKEHECEVKAEEKEELMVTLNKIKAKLDKETAAHFDTKSHITELTQQLNDLSMLVSQCRVTVLLTLTQFHIIPGGYGKSRKVEIGKCCEKW